MITFDSIKDIVRGDYILLYNGQEYLSFDDIKRIADRPERILVKQIESKADRIYITLIDNPVKENDLNAPWVQEHIKNTGSEPSFF